MATAAVDAVQCFGRKKTAVAVAHCKRGRGLIKVNGVPIELVKPEILGLKAFEPILLLGRQRFMGVDIRQGPHEAIGLYLRTGSVGPYGPSRFKLLAMERQLRQVFERMLHKSRQL
ncbi:hypothetical protein B296_00043958 [Ensete ventricosum]|uniref:40S ribosomal protein S16 n=1 Tax=Ensete ventricosum TaxID=4639 RepID=A0A426Z7Y5_ENSVE|nr:hypothetical protein B296_00043958 [Ensete ventricosum]